MKNFTVAVSILLGLAAGLCARPQGDMLQQLYQREGDEIFVPLYWLPETRETVVKHIPDHDYWVGFEPALWERLTEEQKKVLMIELGDQFDKMDGAKLDATWKRMRNWQALSSQIGLLTRFSDNQEGFLELAYRDPTLTPAFTWILTRRPANFDPQHIGSTFSSGEMAAFIPHLIQHLLDTPEKERYECFSRLFAAIAQTTEAEQITR